MAVWRDSICNPTYKCSIEDVVGDPPFQDPNEKLITDVELAAAIVRHVRATRLLRRSAPRRRMWRGCGRGLVSSGRSAAGAAVRAHVALQFVYVTSSDDESVNLAGTGCCMAVFPERSRADNAQQICGASANVFTPNENYDELAAKATTRRKRPRWPTSSA